MIKEEAALFEKWERDFVLFYFTWYEVEMVVGSTVPIALTVSVRVYWQSIFSFSLLNFYRPQCSCGKAMFSHLCVILFIPRQTPPPSRTRLLQRTVCILLESILVFTTFSYPQTLQKLRLISFTNADYSIKAPNILLDMIRGGSRIFQRGLQPQRSVRQRIIWQTFCRKLHEN